jgi:hypothetical protein
MQPGPLRNLKAIQLTVLCLGGAASAEVVPPFSALPVGPVMSAPWTEMRLPGIQPARFEVTASEGTRVLQVIADAAASSLTLPLATQVDDTTALTWRWKVTNVIQQGDIATKSGDDFAARLYVFFDLPLESLSLAQRTKLRLARWLHGEQVPSAALCYVWGNTEAVGTSAWNAYTDRVRVVVLRNAGDAVGEWQGESRTVAADFEQAFGIPAPAVTGLAVAADTDQTGERVTAWFGDIGFERAPAHGDSAAYAERAR